ncbi:unnamed protein product [Brassica oleracea var. botrytis]
MMNVTFSCNKGLWVCVCNRQVCSPFASLFLLIFVVNVSFEFD